MTQRLKEQFKASINPGTGALKDNQNGQASIQTHKGKKERGPNK